VVQADGRDDLGKVQWPAPGSDAKDFFFGGGVKELSDSTSPNAHWMDGSSSGLRVYDIAANGPQMRFSVGKQPASGEVQQPDAGIAADAGAGPGSITDAGTPSSVPDASSGADAGKDGAAAPAQPFDAAVRVDAGGAAPSNESGTAVGRDGDGATSVQAPGADAQTAGPSDELSQGEEGCTLQPRGQRHGSRPGLVLLALLGAALVSRRRNVRRR
jgi:hypothetical protein